MPFQEIPDLTGIIVAGGTINTVTNPVTPDPASTIATVSTSVPFAFRDGAFWPGITGEQFAPALSSAAYADHNNVPAYQGSANTATVTFPRMPRTSISGKQNMRFTMAYAATTPTTNQILQWGVTGNAAMTAASKGFQLSTDGAGNVTLRVSDGTTLQTIAGPQLPFTGAWHSFEIDLSAAGAVTWLIDGVAPVNQPAGTPLAPGTVISPLTPQVALASGAGGWVSQLQIGWS